MPVRKPFAAAAATAGLLAVAAPAAHASDPPTSTTTTTPAPPTLTFTPPKVGQLAVVIGPTIIGGKVIDPGLRVILTPPSIPPMSITLPRFPWTRPT